MAPDDQELSGRSLLAVFSHPDDESLACGGLLAWCADQGVRVTLVCATRGEHGPHGPVVIGPDTSLRDVRTLELMAAARTLGIADVVLLDHPDGYLPWVDASRVEAELLDVMARVRPDVVITFGADGLYWHPDHIAIHQRTTAAVAALGPDAPALYYVTMPQGRMRHVLDGLPPEDPRPTPVMFGVTDLDAFGAGANPPTLVVDVAAFCGRKLAAMRCHQTQLAGGPVGSMTELDAVRLFGTEHFHRAPVGSSGQAFIERFAQAIVVKAS